MTPAFPNVRRWSEHFFSDDHRVIPRYMDFGGGDRIRSIFKRLLAIPESEVSGLFEHVMSDFAPRHRDIQESFALNFEEAARHMKSVPELSALRKLLIGAYFTLEYSIESAALFNPSMVIHPNQIGLGPGMLRILISLRATGEGHVSSIVFRRGVIDPLGRISLDPPPRFAYTARPQQDKLFDKAVFRSKLHNGSEFQAEVERLFEMLPDQFRPSQLKRAVTKIQNEEGTPASYQRLAEEILWLARANYTLSFPSDCRPAETVIFPATEHESRGMEDLRLVRFTHDDGRVMFYGTYTAYDGYRIHPMMLETADFQTFHASTLGGKYVMNKGLALFPRKIKGSYVMLSRHDGENNYLLRSKNLYSWNNAKKIQTPSENWELVQVGNCGSPLETPRGWLVLTHGVGPVREYSIGALLLDLDDPSKVIGRLRDPLLSPTPEEREGYVPNVVYSCGSVIHGEKLVIPYAMSDSRTGFASVPLRELLDRLLHEGS